METQLQLTDEQKGQIKQLLAQFEEQASAERDQLRELFGQMRDARQAGDQERVRELREKMLELRRGQEPAPGGDVAELYQQIREAREAGDLERMRALRQELRELRGRGAAMRGPEGKLIADIRAVLRPDQHEQFNTIVREMVLRGRGARSLQQLMPPRRLVQAAQAADLPPEKLLAIRELVSEFEEALQTTEPRDRRELFGQYRQELQKLEAEINLTGAERERILEAARDAGPPRGPRPEGRRGRRGPDRGRSDGN